VIIYLTPFLISFLYSSCLIVLQSSRHREITRASLFPMNIPFISQNSFSDYYTYKQEITCMFLAEVKGIDLTIFSHNIRIGSTECAYLSTLSKIIFNFH
jgi:hypothetical protein